MVVASEVDQQQLDYQLVMAGATKHGADIAKIDSLLKSGANPNARLNDYSPPLIFATLYQDWKCADRLLEDPRTDPNVHDSRSGTPLLYAVDNKNYDLAKQLIERGAKVDVFGGRCPSYVRSLIQATGDQELIAMMPNKYDAYRQLLLSSKKEFKKSAWYFKNPNLLIGNRIDCSDDYVKEFLEDLNWSKERLIHIAVKHPTSKDEVGLHWLPKDILKLVIEFVQTPGRLKKINQVENKEG